MSEQTTLSGTAMRTLRAAANSDVFRAAYGDRYFMLRSASKPLGVTEDVEELLAAGLVAVSVYEVGGAHYVVPTPAGDATLSGE